MRGKEPKLSEPVKKQKKPVSSSGVQGGSGEDEEPDLECLDWWTKYHASVDSVIQVRVNSHFNFN